MSTTRFITSDSPANFRVVPSREQAPIENDYMIRRAVGNHMSFNRLKEDGSVTNPRQRGARGEVYRASSTVALCLKNNLWARFSLRSEGIPGTMVRNTDREADFDNLSAFVNDSSLHDLRLSRDGSTLVYSNYRNGEIGDLRVFLRTAVVYNFADIIGTDVDDFGRAFDITSDGSVIVVAANGFASPDAGIYFSYRASIEPPTYTSPARDVNDRISLSRANIAIMTGFGPTLYYVAYPRDTAVGTGFTIRRMERSAGPFFNTIQSDVFGEPISTFTDFKFAKGFAFTLTGFLFVEYIDGADIVVDRYELVGGLNTWIRTEVTRFQSDFGYSHRIAVSDDATFLAVGDPKANEVRVFQLQGPTYVLLDTVVPEPPETGISFGRSLAISNNGTKLIVGAPSYSNFSGTISGRVYGYSLIGSTYVYLDQFDSRKSENSFGLHVSIAGDGSTSVAAGDGDVGSSNLVDEILAFDFTPDTIGISQSWSY